jgi:cyclopropane fatty-acyl-phospholipid synthase-like methyltransferase
MTIRCENAGRLDQARLVSPSAERNKGPVAEVLQRVLPESGCILEVSSGTGQHVVYFARVMPHLVWQPTEYDQECLQSIAAWCAFEGLANVKPPVALDVHDEVWPAGQVEAVVCINMIHIAPISATGALLRGASRNLNKGGVFVLYGPFRRGGEHTSQSNEDFDQLLRAQNPGWGVRNLDEVADTALREGFALEEVCPMPANNLIAIFRKR